MPLSRRDLLAAAGASLALRRIDGSEAPAVSSRPNFVVFLTDDQGYGDLGCMGAADLRTPHIDSLARSGAVLTDWYSNSPVSSPSRASLLTGRYPFRAGVRTILGGDRHQSRGLPPGVPTIATALRDLGYRTALFGKWHLGGAPEYRPDRHGFDEWWGMLAGCVDYYSHIFYWGGGDPFHDLWHNGREVWEDGEYLTEAIGRRAAEWVDRVAGGGEPFLLYVPFNAPHYPMHAPSHYRERFPDLPWQRQIMAAMLAAVDDAVGLVLDALRRNGLLEDTLVYYQSDNGPSRETRNWLDGTRDPYYGGTSGPLKGHKFSLFEGGVRVPAVVSWPARIPGGQMIREPGAAMDLFPTILRAAGGDPDRYALDGRDALPLFAEGAASPHESLFWEMDDQTAIRRGPHKLVLNGRLVEGEPAVAPTHLADLEADPAESSNLADELPDLTADLRAEAEAWRGQCEREWSESRERAT